MTAQLLAIRQNELNTQSADTRWKGLYRIGGAAALVALSANLLDVILGFGETDIIVNGTKTALEWFALFREDWFKGLYVLGFLNIIYMASMVPVYFAIFTVHHRSYGVYAGLAMVVYFIGMAIYISNSAAIPMFVLSGRYAAAGTDTQRALFAAAGEAVLARGEDFTPGSFTGLIFGGIAAIGMSFVMLRGGIFREGDCLDRNHRFHVPVRVHDLVDFRTGSISRSLLLFRDDWRLARPGVVHPDGPQTIATWIGLTLIRSAVPAQASKFTQPVLQTRKRQ